MPKDLRGQKRSGDLISAPIKDVWDAEREPASTFYARLSAESGTDIDLETTANGSRRKHSGPVL